MKFVADLHIHSRFSRATSSDLTAENLWLWGQYKGINLVGTGDCIHPLWLKELQERLEPEDSGFFRLRPSIAEGLSVQVPSACRGEVRFVLSTEISCIYKKNAKVRKVHCVVIFSSLEACSSFQQRLAALGNIKSDGRPILGLDAKDLLALALECDPQVVFVPAHIWTPWFSVLGAASGFDSLKECFEDLVSHVFAVETGLSSDPQMNWRLSGLDDVILLSNSDAHSVSKLGREANLFDTEFSYAGVYRALADRKDPGMTGTIEFFPEEGKYHYDGHRACKVRLHPRQTAAGQGACPVCGKPVTTGVMSRVEALADHPQGRRGLRARPYFNLVPLQEVIAESRGVGCQSKQVRQAWFDMISRLGPELGILMERSLTDIAAVGGDVLAEGIRLMREGKIVIQPGYDGEYGVIRIFDEHRRKNVRGQMSFL